MTAAWGLEDAVDAVEGFLEDAVDAAEGFFEDAVDAAEGLFEDVLEDEVLVVALMLVD
jgi:hypothetical protein